MEFYGVVGYDEFTDQQIRSWVTLIQGQGHWRSKGQKKIYE